MKMDFFKKNVKGFDICKTKDGFKYVFVDSEQIFNLSFKEKKYMVKYSTGQSFLNGDYDCPTTTYAVVGDEFCDHLVNRLSQSDFVDGSDIVEEFKANFEIDATVEELFELYVFLHEEAPICEVVEFDSSELQFT